MILSFLKRECYPLFVPDRLGVFVSFTPFVAFLRPEVLRNGHETDRNVGRSQNHIYASKNPCKELR
jgi:hypothetical protein